jgi:surfactin synthase thioesterase subunit
MDDVQRLAHPAPRDERSPAGPAPCRWLPFSAPAGSTVRLITWPHAGAGASAFRAWGRSLPPTLGVWPLQPPGRETRRHELPVADVHRLASSCADEVLACLEGPYALFGHSTGAVGVFELCREIRRRGGPSPRHLFVSGRRAPQIRERTTGIEALGLNELADVLRRHGGTPEWVLTAPGMLTTLRPLLVADFAVSENYQYIAEPALDVPITAIAADADPRASVAAVEAWAVQTEGGFACHVIRGGHFAVLEQQQLVHELIAEALGQRNR